MRVTDIEGKPQTFRNILKIYKMFQKQSYAYGFMILKITFHYLVEHVHSLKSQLPYNSTTDKMVFSNVLSSVIWAFKINLVCVSQL